jgi:hypothetical protein
MEHVTQQFSAAERWAKLLRPRYSSYTRTRMTIRFKPVSTLPPGPVNEWAKARYNTGGDVTHYGFLSGVGEIVWVFPLRPCGTRLALHFNQWGTVQEVFELRYTDEELMQGLKVLR